MNPEEYSIFAWVGLTALIFLFGISLIKRGARKFLAELIPKAKL